jgi:hypothetical protein
MSSLDRMASRHYSYRALCCGETYQQLGDSFLFLPEQEETLGIGSTAVCLPMKQTA